MLGWLFCTKTIVLKTCSCLKVRWVRPSKAGLGVVWYLGGAVVLLPGGSVLGASYVESWFPHSGWSDADLAAYKDAAKEKP